MMRELTGKVIDLLEDSSLEAIKVSANRQPSLFHERWLGMQLPCGFAPAACRSSAPFCHPRFEKLNKALLLPDVQVTCNFVSSKRSTPTLLDVSVLCIHHCGGHSTVAHINASNVCCA
jgi:hypothetical protein